MMRKSFWLIFTLVFLLLILPIIIYSINFYDQPISDKTEVWGQLGDYLNPFIALLNLFTVGFFSYRILKLEENRDSANRPVIDLDFIFPEQPFTYAQIQKEGILIGNAGKSIAFDISIVVVITGRSHPLVSGFDLVDGKKQYLHIGRQDWESCIVTYKDISGIVYTNRLVNPDIIPVISEEELDILFGKDSWLIRLRQFLRCKSKN